MGPKLRYTAVPVPEPLVVLLSWCTIVYVRVYMLLQTLPFNRLWISFFSPSLVYVPNSHTLQYVGLGLSQAADYGFAELKSAIAALQDGGVEVFLSMGVCDVVLRYRGVPKFWTR